MMRALACLFLLPVLLPGLMLTLAAAQAAAPRTDADVAAAVDFAPPVGARLPALSFSGVGPDVGSDVASDEGFAGESPVALRDLLARRPTLLTFAWFECANLCGLTLNALADSTARLSADVPQDFQVVVVSLDAAAGREQALQQQRQLAVRYPAAGVERRWHFLTGEAGDIEALANAIGYRFIYDQRKAQFAHPAGVVAVSPDGRIADYRAGVHYRSQDIDGLLRAARGEAASVARPNPVLLLCYDYDPNSGRYSLAIMKLLRLTAVIALLAIAGAILYWQRQARRGMQ